MFKHLCVTFGSKQTRHPTSSWCMDTKQHFKCLGRYRPLPSPLNLTAHKNSCKQQAALQYPEKYSPRDTSAWWAKDKVNLLQASAFWKYRSSHYLLTNRSMKAGCFAVLPR